MADTKKNVNLDIDFDNVETDEVEEFLQSGSRAIPEYAASCNTIIVQAEDTNVGSCTSGSGLQTEIME